MNRHLRVAAVIAVLLVLCVEPLGVVQSAVSGTGFNPATSIPWKTKTVIDDDIIASDISVGFGGTNQYPLISYYAGSTIGASIFAMPAVGDKAGYGNCGVGNTWYCGNFPQSARIGKTSRMAVYKYQNSFKVAWAYEYFSPATDILYLLTREYRDDLLDAGGSDLPFVFTGIYPDYDFDVAGPPSLVFDEFGNPHLALLLQFGGFFRVVYAYKVNGTPAAPCNNDPDTHFQCDIIYDSHIPIFNEIHLVLTASGEPRISFFQFADESLIYAYPQPNLNYQPNCGPGHTWRCVVIESSTYSHDFYAGGNDPILLDMAIGPASPHLIIKARDAEMNTLIRYATFVGSGGNCGLDFARTSLFPPEYTQVYRWQCSSYVWDNQVSPAYLNFSLQVDSFDYPVIALNKWAGLSYNVGVVYPAERAGGTPGSWKYDKVDGYQDINTGKAVGLALGKDDSSLMGFAELEDYAPKLRIAYQNIFKNYVPSVRQ